MKMHFIAIAVGTMQMTAASSSVVLAATCASAPIEARGEPSRFVWIAKTKARSNWRAKVRRTPGLGTSYANWPRANNSEERCLTGPSGTLCIFTGTPCLP